MRFSDRQRHVIQGWEREGKFRLLSGPRQCGKTESGIALTMNRASRLFTGHDFFLMARRQSQMDSNVIARINHWAQRNDLPMLERVPNKNKVWRFPSLHGGYNNFIEVLGSDSTDRSAKNIQGLPLAGGYIDEMTLMPKTLVDMALGGMLTIPGSTLVGTMNPDHPQHPVRTDYILPLENNSNPDITGEYHEFTMADNPLMTVSELRQTAAGYSGTYFKRMILGQWVASDLTVYNLTDDNFGTMPDYVAPAKWHVSIDFGRSSVTYAMLTAVRDNASYVVDECLIDMTQTGVISVSAQIERIYNCLLYTSPSPRDS